MLQKEADSGKIICSKKIVMKAEKKDFSFTIFVCTYYHLTRHLFQLWVILIHITVACLFTASTRSKEGQPIDQYGCTVQIHHNSVISQGWQSGKRSLK